MLSARTRALLDRYALASRALSRDTGERIANEAGQSVEFHDFRQYQPGDELRYVDWRVYARTGRLYTRLHQAERTIRLHLLLDTSASMRLGGKGEYARRLAQLITYLAQRDSRSQVHLFDGRRSRPARGLAGISDAWAFIEAAGSPAGGDVRRPEAPAAALTRFALELPPQAGAALVLVVSDLFDPAPLQAALAALRARSLDASFLQPLARQDLDPAEEQLELLDAESGERLDAGPAEVRAYRQAVRAFVGRTRAAILKASFRHTLLPVPESEGEELEREAFAALIREGVIEKR